MSYENPRISGMRSEASAAGEIVSVTTDTITIGGIFSPGLSVDLRPGRRVIVLTEDDVIDLATAPGLDL